VSKIVHVSRSVWVFHGLFDGWSNAEVRGASTAPSEEPLFSRGGFLLENINALGDNSSNPDGFSPALARGEAMTLQEVINKSGIFLLLCLETGAFSSTNPAPADRCSSSGYRGADSLPGSS